MPTGLTQDDHIHIQGLKHNRDYQKIFDFLIEKDESIKVEINILIKEGSKSVEPTEDSVILLQYKYKLANKRSAPGSVGFPLKGAEQMLESAIATAAQKKPIIDELKKLSKRYNDFLTSLPTLPTQSQMVTLTAQLAELEETKELLYKKIKQTYSKNIPVDIAKLQGNIGTKITNANKQIDGIKASLSVKPTATPIKPPLPPPPPPPPSSIPKAAPSPPLATPIAPVKVISEEYKKITASIAHNIKKCDEITTGIDKDIKYDKDDYDGLFEVNKDPIKKLEEKANHIHKKITELKEQTNNLSDDEEKKTINIQISKLVDKFQKTDTELQKARLKLYSKVFKKLQTDMDAFNPTSKDKQILDSFAAIGLSRVALNGKISELNDKDSKIDHTKMSEVEIKLGDLISSYKKLKNKVIEADKAKPTEVDKAKPFVVKEDLLPKVVVNPAPLAVPIIVDDDENTVTKTTEEETKLDGNTTATVTTKTGGKVTKIVATTTGSDGKIISTETSTTSDDGTTIVVTTKPDGTTVTQTVTTKPDGTTVTQTPTADGGTQTVTTKPDGTTVTQTVTTKPDGTTVTQTPTADGGTQTVTTKPGGITVTEIANPGGVVISKTTDDNANKIKVEETMDPATQKVIKKVTTDNDKKTITTEEINTAGELVVTSTTDLNGNPIVNPKVIGKPPPTVPPPVDLTTATPPVDLTTGTGAGNVNDLTGTPPVVTTGTGDGADTKPPLSSSIIHSGITNKQSKKNLTFTGSGRRIGRTRFTRTRFMSDDLKELQQELREAQQEQRQAEQDCKQKQREVKQSESNLQREDKAFSGLDKQARVAERNNEKAENNANKAQDKYGNLKSSSDGNIRNTTANFAKTYTAIGTASAADATAAQAVFTAINNELNNPTTAGMQAAIQNACTVGPGIFANGAAVHNAAVGATPQEVASNALNAIGASLRTAVTAMPASPAQVNANNSLTNARNSHNLLTPILPELVPAATDLDIANTSLQTARAALSVLQPQLEQQQTTLDTVQETYEEQSEELYELQEGLEEASDEVDSIKVKIALIKLSQGTDVEDELNDIENNNGGIITKVIKENPQLAKNRDVMDFLDSNDIGGDDGLGGDDGPGGDERSPEEIELQKIKNRFAVEQELSQLGVKHAAMEEYSAHDIAKLEKALKADTEQGGVVLDNMTKVVTAIANNDSKLVESALNNITDNLELHQQMSNDALQKNMKESHAIMVEGIKNLSEEKREEAQAMSQEIKELKTKDREYDDGFYRRFMTCLTILGILSVIAEYIEGNNRKDKIKALEVQKQAYHESLKRGDSAGLIQTGNEAINANLKKLIESNMKGGVDLSTYAGGLKQDFSFAKNTVAQKGIEKADRQSTSVDTLPETVLKNKTRLSAAEDIRRKLGGFNFNMSSVGSVSGTKATIHDRRPPSRSKAKSS